MAKRSKSLKNVRNKTRRRVKPQATEEQMLDMARRYRVSYPWDTPESIYNARNKVHEEMAQYSNPEIIDKYIRNYEDEPSNLMHTLIPMNYIFPGYQPIVSNGNVTGYEPTDSSSWVPEDFVPVNYSEDNYNSNDIYPPDFKNTFLWYINPNSQSSSSSSELNSEDSIISDEDLITSNEELMQYPPSVRKYEELTPAILDQYDNMLKQQYDYASLHNQTFNYIDPRIVEFMDTYGISPTDLFQKLRQRYASGVVHQKPVPEVTSNVYNTNLSLQNPGVNVPSTKKRNYSEEKFNGRRTIYGPITRDQFMISQDLDDARDTTSNLKLIKSQEEMLDQIYNIGQLLDRFIYRKDRVRDKNTGKVISWWPNLR